MSKKNIIYLFVSLILIIYMVFTVSATNFMASQAECSEVRIHVDNSGISDFVTANDIDRELGGLRTRYTGAVASQIPLQEIEDRINALVNIEDANVFMGTDNVMQIDVVPMHPVVRVFEDSCSYYINRAGKHLTADLHYNIDLPVVIRRPGAPEAVVAVDLAERIAQNPAWNQLVTAMEIRPNGDIMLIPSIRGHIINFGDQYNIDDKFKRLLAFYNKVMPMKGWDAYEMVSVKFAGQVIGTLTPKNRRTKIDDFIADIPNVSEDTDAGSLESNINPRDNAPRIE